MGVHRPALAHEHAREPRRARRQRHPAAARAGAHRHQLVAARRRSASTPGACCSRWCTRSCRCSPKRRTTRPTASCCSVTSCPRSTCGRSSGARTTAGGCRRSARRRLRHADRRVAERRVRIPAVGDAGRARSSEVGEETRLMTRAAGLARGNDQAEAVLGRLNRLVGRQLPDFAVTSHAPAPPSPRLNAAIVEAQESVARRLAGATGTDASGRRGRSTRRRCSRSCTSGSRRSSRPRPRRSSGRRSRSSRCCSRAS